MPAVKCSSLAQSYTFSNATWTTTDKLSNPSYCYKSGGNLYPHITIIQTGGGKNDFKKFHITTEAENSEIKINYFYDIGKSTLYYDGLNYGDFPSHRKQAINAHLGDLSEADNSWHEIALAFCNRIGATVTEDIELAGPSGIE